MKRTRSDVTDAELAVLKILWDRGASTIRQITDLLYPAGEASHYATVQKLLERLQTKGCVRRRPEGRGHIYSAAVERDDLIARRLRDTADKLCEGSLTPLLTHLASATKLSRKELAALREIVERRRGRSRR
jgi:predicted transcriptional regulator